MIDFSSKTGFYDSRIIMDLSQRATVHDADLPFAVYRMLATINVGKEPDKKHGLLNPTGSKDDMCYKAMNHIVDIVGRSPYFGQYPGLHAMEKDNASKIVDATGFRPMAYFTTEDYPWHEDKPKGCFAHASMLAVSKWYETVLSSMSGATNWWHSFGPSRIMGEGSTLKYRKGSSYGIFPYVPGSSGLNPLSLVYHACTARMIQDFAVRTHMTEGSDFFSKVNDFIINESMGHCYMQHPLAIMQLRRARPIKKPIPIWNIDVPNQSIYADRFDVRTMAGSREIKAIPASANMLATGVAQVFSSMIHKIFGLHVGHPLQTATILNELQDAWGAGNVHTYAEDISGFDNSYNSKHADLFNELVLRLFPGDKWVAAYLHYLDTCPIATAGLFEKRGGYTMLQRNTGLASGDQLTTMKGTTVNLCLKVDVMAALYGISPQQALDRCFNYRRSLGQSVLGCTWALALKGDDVVIFTRGEKLNKDDIADLSSDRGFKSDVEPGPIFLMQYLSTTLKQEVDTLIGMPPMYKGKILPLTTGLAAKRVGNRFVFTEHTIKDEAPLKHAIFSSLIDLQKHPAYDFVHDLLITQLNETVGSKFTGLKALSTYLLSKEGIAEMQAFATSKPTDPFIKEFARRYLEVRGHMGEVGDDEALPRELLSITNALRTTSVLGFGSKVNDSILANFGDEGVNLTVAKLDLSDAAKIRKEILNILFHEKDK